jgi:ketosteroid isomerase-like protein
MTKSRHSPLALTRIIIKSHEGLMIRTIIASLVLVLGALPALAQTPPDQLYTASHQQLDVTKALLAQQTAWNHGDLDGYLSRYKDAADTEAILAFPVRGLANIRAAFRTNYPNRETMGNLEQSEVEVRELGENFALATGKYHLARPKKNGGDAEGSFTEIFEKTPTGWLVIFSETT